MIKNENISIPTERKKMLLLKNILLIDNMGLAFIFMNYMSSFSEGGA